MRIIITISLLFLAGISFSQKKGNLTVVVSNISAVKGHMQLGLFNKSENFPKPGKEYKVVRFKVTSKKMKYTFKGLKQGDYALAIYHDKNSDKECNRNFIGIPTEDYGFSNNIKPVLSAPSFKDTKVNLKEKLSILIKLL